MIAEAYYEAMETIASHIPERPLPKGLNVVETNGWRLAANNSAEPVEWEGESCGASVPPYNVVAVQKGSINMAVLDAGGGCIGGGMTEDQFIEEMKADRRKQHDVG